MDPKYVWQAGTAILVAGYTRYPVYENGGPRSATTVFAGRLAEPLKPGSSLIMTPGQMSGNIVGREFETELVCAENKDFSQLTDAEFQESVNRSWKNGFALDIRTEDRKAYDQNGCRHYRVFKDTADARNVFREEGEPELPAFVEELESGNLPWVKLFRFARTIVYVVDWLHGSYGRMAVKIDQQTGELLRYDREAKSYRKLCL